MSRPREVREAQRNVPRRHPEMFDELIEALDEAEYQEDDIDLTQWSMPTQPTKEKQS